MAGFSASVPEVLIALHRAVRFASRSGVSTFPRRRIRVAFAVLPCFRLFPAGARKGCFFAAFNGRVTRCVFSRTRGSGTFAFYPLFTWHFYKFRRLSQLTILVRGHNLLHRHQSDINKSFLNSKPTRRRKDTKDKKREPRGAALSYYRFNLRHRCGRIRGAFPTVLKNVSEVPSGQFPRNLRQFFSVPVRSLTSASCVLISVLLE